MVNHVLQFMQWFVIDLSKMMHLVFMVLREILLAWNQDASLESSLLAVPIAF